jgi:hypothetical protein
LNRVPPKFIYWRSDPNMIVLEIRPIDRSYILSELIKAGLWCDGVGAFQEKTHHRALSQQCEDTGAGSPVQIKNRAFTRNQPCLSLTWNLYLLELWEYKFILFQSPSLYFITLVHIYYRPGAVFIFSSVFLFFIFHIRWFLFLCIWVHLLFPF